MDLLQHEILDRINTELERIISQLYERGFHTYIVGGCNGVDLMATAAVLRLKEAHPDVKIVAAIPYKGHGKSYKGNDKELYAKMLDSAYITTYIAESYYKAAFLKRNEYMLENASVVVCYYNGYAGGTKYTYNRALTMGHEIINICKEYRQ